MQSNTVSRMSKLKVYKAVIKPIIYLLCLWNLDPYKTHWAIRMEDPEKNIQEYKHGTILHKNESRSPGPTPKVGYC